MKKAWIIFILLLLIGLYHSMKAQDQSFNEFTGRRKQITEDRQKIKALFETGQYDSAVNYSVWLRKNDKLSYDETENVLAIAYWYKGDRNTAYQYIIRQTDYNWALNASDAFSDALSDYEYAYPLATDTFLEKIIVDKVRDAYLKQDFPEASAGFKLLLLHYESQKRLAKYNYDLNHKQDIQQQELLKRQFEEDKSVYLKRFLDIISSHGDFYTWKEAGNGYRFQRTFRNGFKDSAFHAMLKPYYERSFRAGDIKQEEYVETLLLTTGIPQSDTTKLSIVRDSLCKIYKCRPLERNVVWFNNGDSTVMYPDSVIMYKHDGTAPAIIKKDVKEAKVFPFER